MYVDSLKNVVNDLGEDTTAVNALLTLDDIIKDNPDQQFLYFG